MPLRTVGLRTSFNDLSYRFYDRVRHRDAFRVAAVPGETAADLTGLRGRKYAVLVSNRRDGTPVPTPVWFGLDDAGRIYVHTEERTAKVRRIRRDPQVRVFPSDPRGKPLGPAVECTARIVDAAEEARAEATIAANYGAERRLYERALMHGLETVYLEMVPVTPAAGP